MLFMYIHTHTPEACIAGQPQEQMKIFDKVRQDFLKARIKVTGAYSAPTEHTVFYILEADDIVALNRALTPMIRWGSSRLIPIESNDFMLS